MQSKMKLVDHKPIFGINIRFYSLKQANFRPFLLCFKVFFRPERSNSSRNASSVMTRAGTTTGSWSDVCEASSYMFKATTRSTFRFGSPFCPLPLSFPFCPFSCLSCLSSPLSSPFSHASSPEPRAFLSGPPHQRKADAMRNQALWDMGKRPSKQYIVRDGCKGIRFFAPKYIFVTA